MEVTIGTIIGEYAACHKYPENDCFAWDWDPNTLWLRRIPASILVHHPRLATPTNTCSFPHILAPSDGPQILRQCSIYHHIYLRLRNV